MKKFHKFALLAIAAVFLSLLGAPSSHAQNNGSFSLQVTPSPLVTTIKPGQAAELELKIRNASSSTEFLKIEPRAFGFDSQSGQVRLQDVTPAEVTGWIAFGAPKFTVQSGQWFTEKIRISLPKDVGFSYSFALVISRQKDTKLTEGGRVIKGAVAVFTLVNVDRPDATRKLGIAEFSSNKHFYEYLPSTLTLKLNNTGNTIVQPYGNIFIQRGSTAKTPLVALPVNDSHGYILPGTTRALTTEWNDGFPVFKSYSATDGKIKQKLVWNWSNISHLRIGRYTAKLIAVYNDGQRDIPIQGEVSFWVVPWKILLGLVVFVVVLLLGLWSIIRKIIDLVRHKKYKTRLTE